MMMLEYEINNIFEKVSRPGEDVSDKYVILYLLWLQKKNEGDRGIAMHFDNSITANIENPDLRERIERRVKEIGVREIERFFDTLDKYAHDADLIKNSLILNDEKFYKIWSDSTPKVVSKLASAILDVKENESFADFYCGKGEMIVNGDINTKDITCYDINDSAILTSMIRSAVKGLSAKFEKKDLLKDEIERSFDRIYAEPPMGQKYESKDLCRMEYLTGMPIRERQSDWAAVATAIKHLNDSGRAVFVLPAGTAFNSRSEDIRQDLLTKQLLSAVIEFPAGALTYTGAKILMYVIEKKANKSVRMVNLIELVKDSSKYLIKDTLEQKMPEIIRACFSSENTSISKVVSYNEIMSDVCCSFLPSSYFKEDLGFTCEKHCLKDFISIYKGINIPADELNESCDETACVSINVSDIQDCVLTKKTYVEEVKTSVRNICTVKKGYGYMIISRMLHPRRTCILEEKAGKKIFSGANTFILEFDREALDPYYLQYCFVHAEGKLFSHLAQGTTLSLLTSKSFEEMEIPVPDLDTQIMISSSFKETIDRIMSAKQALALANEELKTIDLFKGIITK